ncbi:DUF4365 domain-containing protein [Bradyrhizobium lupini]|uniref:DUF4365 domain-containing protein n=1 Tax=Rhizobium lupini TaxID=136996 RepID=UPI00366C5325
MDELATAFVQAAASAAGVTIAVSRLDYGVDGTLKHVVRKDQRYIETGYPVDFQLKATTIHVMGGGEVKFDLKARNYDLIVERQPSATPYYLFLVCFPVDRESWLIEKSDCLMLNASGYWWTDAGVRTRNTGTVRVSIPPTNRLTSAAISKMMEASKRRFVP